MSQIGGDIGGKVGEATGGPQQTQYPSFTSPGGITAQQGALADYDYGQNLTEGQAQFEGSDQGGGPSLSTMATQVAGGANTGKALDKARMSDVNQNADYEAYKNAINIDQQNNAASLAETEQGQQNTDTLAKLAGSAAGSAAAGVPSGTST